MAATVYTDQQEYLKFLQKKACSEHGHGHDCGCKEEKCDENECTCCPTGLIATYDDKGQHLACLTPNDAELYKKNTLTCQDGYIKLVVTSTGEFLGCVSEDTFADLFAVVNP